jgi:glycosyltransferase involved in cell wall biosynthesis
MRIGFFGSRGIPACYSGFETFIEQLTVRLARRGYDVTVYNRVPFNPYRESLYKGVKIVHLPTIRTKATDTIIHTTLSAFHSLSQQYDIAYFCGVGNSLLSIIPKLKGARTILNVDGADFTRAKWTGFGRWWLRKSENWASRIADVVIADNSMISKRYHKLYGIDAILIPYGSNIVTADPGQDTLRKFNLQSKNYFFYVSRLTPENEAQLTIEAYLASRQKLPLVIVGDAPYQSTYIDRIKALAARSSKIILTGFQFGPAYQQLSYHAGAFILPTAIEATRPVLLDQMGFGNAVIVRNTPGNLEVIDDAGLTFSDNDPVHSLASVMDRLAERPEEIRELGQRAQARMQKHYDWEIITSRYEEVFQKLLNEKRR